MVLRRSRHPAVGARPVGALLLLILSWLLLVWCAFQSPRSAVMASSLMHTAFGIAVFVSHGGSRMTVTGLYFLASAVFVGLAGLGVALYLPSSLDVMLKTSVLGSFSANLLIYTLFGHASQKRVDIEALKAESPRVVRYEWFGWLGVSLIILGLALIPGPDAVRAIWQSAGFMGTVLVFVVGIEHWTQGVLMRHVRWLVAASIAAWIFVTLFFSGSGRLIVASIGISILLLVSNMRPRTWYKWLMVFALVPSLILGGLVRAYRELGGTIYSGKVSTSDLVISGTGLGSIYGPIDIFAELVRVRSQSPDRIPMRYGQTFVEALMGPIPRPLWPDKPYGFGTQITEWLVPHLVGVHSFAATAYGEWYVNFGWAGLGLGAVVIGGVLLWMDVRLVRAVRERGRDFWAYARAVGWGVLAAGIADYVWVGLFTYVGRSGIRVAFFWGVVLVALLLFDPTRRRRRSVAGRIRSAPAQ